MKTMMIKSYQSGHNRLTLVRFVLFIVAVYCTIVVGVLPTAADGLGGLFLLPLSFSIACVFSGRAITYVKDSFGLLILYALIVLRYLVSPVLIAISGCLVPGVSTSAAGLRFAIVIMIVELCTMVITVNRIWKPIHQCDPAVDGYGKMKLSMGGALVCLVLIVMILYRGTLPNIWEHLSFGWNFKISRVALKTYDMAAFLTLKAFFFLLLVSQLSRMYHRSNNNANRTVYIGLSILAAVVNMLIFDATNRATMVIGAMASLTVLLSCFGEKIKRFLPIIAVCGALFVWSLFAYGTLGIKNGESFADQPNSVETISNMAELYSNGVSTEAHAFDMYEGVRKKISIFSYISELIQSNNIFTLPGFWVVGGWAANIPSIQRLFNMTLYGKAFILPNAGLAMYSASEYFGWLVDIIFHIIIVKWIYYFYKKKQRSSDISYQYLYVYCEMICAFGLMNNVMIVCGLLSAIPFMLFVLLKVNEIRPR